MRSVSAHSLLMLALALLLSSRAARAEVVELRTGERVEGGLRHASPAGVLIEVGGQVLTFSRDAVRAIYFQPPAPPSPRPAAAQALDALKAVRAAVAAGTSPREYTPRVGEASVVVDRYLASSSGAAAPGRDALADAMRYYELAEFAWRNHSVASDTVWLRKDEALDRCPGYAQFVQAAQAGGDTPDGARTRSYVAISDRVLGVLWACAADRVADAENAIAGAAP